MTFETKINDRIKAAEKKGRIESLISLVRKGFISSETAASESGLTVEEFMQKMNPASACEDEAEYGIKQP